MSKFVFKFITILSSAGLVVSFLSSLSTASAYPSLDATPISSDLRNPRFVKDPCVLDPNNLIVNGSMAPGHDTQYGSAADNWEPFIFDGPPPHFRWVGNEQIDPNGSQQIYFDNTFDAGIWQTVHNLQPGVYYWFRLGYSLAAKSYGGPNVRVDSIGRKVGVDPFGGTDPKSPNVIWGPDYFNGVAAVNISEMAMVFAARSPNATIFLRAMARDGSNGENRVWLDAVCMEAKTDMPTATPLPPTATLVPPTATTRPTQTRAPATKVAQVPTNTPPVATPTVTATPTDTPAPSITPRFARPDVTPVAGAPFDLGTGVVVGLGAALFIGALFFFGAGFLWWRHLG